MEKNNQQRTLFWLGAMGILAIIIAIVIQIANPSDSNIPADGSYLEITEQDHIKGAENASVTIVEYSDFQCPYCQGTSLLLDKLIEDFPNDVRVVYRHLPLSSIHANAYLASQASEAAANQGKFWEMHDMIFANAEQWSNAANASQLFQNYAEQLGLNTEQFMGDMLNNTNKDKIETDIATAGRLGLTGTPSLFANGNKINNSSNYAGLKNQIEQYVQQDQ